MDKTYQDLVAQLRDKTARGKAMWNQEGRATEFVLHLDCATVLVDRWPDHEQGEMIQLSVFAPEGRRIDDLIVARGDDDTGAFEILAGLHEAVRRHACRVDETLAAILQELRNRDEVGREKNDASDIEDSIPF
ncbi:MAG: hypothetical protein ACLFOY_02360 [Desulfatibacillaceae bacterium]